MIGSDHSIWKQAEATAELRRHMVQQQIAARGVSDPRVLAAMEKVPRECFVQAERLERAYGDHPLSIGHGQTISQPYMVARMTELLALTPTDRVLEVGAGSGYQTAILALLAHHVIAVERIAELSERGRRAVARLGFSNVTWLTGDGTLGVPEYAPYDGILVAAGAPAPPAPLLEQLAPGGRMVIPVGARHYQELQVIRRRPEGGLDIQRDTLCRFVDLIGAHGWPEGPEGQG